MHANSLKLMGYFLDRLPWLHKGRVIDVGSQDINGTYRDLIDAYGAEYVGLDIAAGENVDVVVPECGPWDVVISGQCVEHVRKPWKWIRHMSHIAKQGAFVIIITPWKFPEHRYPIDCWRILPDGMAVLLEEGGFDVFNTGIDNLDCYGIGMKPIR